MTREGLEILLERVSTWPEEDQKEFVQFVSDVESRHLGSEPLTDEDRAAIMRGLADVNAGRFASDGAVEALFSRYFK
jgi:hypothetical protein